METCRRSRDGIPRSTKSLRDFVGPDKILILCPTCLPYADWLLRPHPGVVRVESSKRRVTLHLAHEGDAEHVGDAEAIARLATSRPAPPAAPAPTATNAGAQQAEYELYRWRIRHETHGEFVERRRREREATGLKRVYRSRAILAEPTAAAYDRRMRALPARAFTGLAPRYGVPRYAEPHIQACMRRLAMLCAEHGAPPSFEAEGDAPRLPRRFAPARGDCVRAAARGDAEEAPRSVPEVRRKRARLAPAPLHDEGEVIEFFCDSD